MRSLVNPLAIASLLIHCILAKDAGRALGAKYGLSGGCQQPLACLLSDPALATFAETSGPQPKGSATDLSAANLRLPAVASSVVLIVVKGGVSVCTGTLVNNGRRNGRPLILTAAHCLEQSQDYAADYRVLLHYEQATCPLGQPEVLSGGALKWPAWPSDPSVDSILGVRPLAIDRSLDVALLEISGGIKPGTALHLAGWNLRRAVPPAALLVHHPSGDAKMYATTGGSWIREHEDIHDRPVFIVDAWWRGAVEKGSSGAGLLGPDGRVCGVLLGGSSACRVQVAMRRDHLALAASGESTSKSMAKLRRAATDDRGQPVVPDIFRPLAEALKAVPEMRAALDPENRGLSTLAGYTHVY